MTVLQTHNGSQPHNSQPDSGSLTPPSLKVRADLSPEELRQLLRLFIQEVQQTGRCTYPDLVTHLQATYALDTDPQAAALPPAVIQQLSQDLDWALAHLCQASLGLNRCVYDLSTCLTQPESFSAEAAIALRQEIQHQGRSLCQSITHILAVAQRHGPRGEGQASSLASSPALHNYAVVRKCYSDLQYISAYLQEQLTVELHRTSLIPTPSPFHHFRRLHQYLDVLPAQAALLVDLVQTHLQTKSWGDRFEPIPTYSPAEVL